MPPSIANFNAFFTAMISGLHEIQPLPLTVAALHFDMTMPRVIPTAPDRTGGRVGMLCAVLALSLSPGSSMALGAPIPAGTEFQVNTYTTDAQYAPAVASDSAGNFVVVWASYL